MECCRSHGGGGVRKWLTDSVVTWLHFCKLEKQGITLSIQKKQMRKGGEEKNNMATVPSTAVRQSAVEAACHAEEGVQRHQRD
jgi:hypothetical protein